MQGKQTGWQRLAQPGLVVELSYPSSTPHGYSVDRVEERVEGHPVAGDFERVHLTSPGSDELYVEVARFPARTPHDEYATHRPSLEQRFGVDSVTELTETSMRELPSWTYGFRWEEGERAVLLLQVGNDTYRVIYDPRSELSREVIATLSITE